MLFCDMRSGKFNSPLMAQLLSVLTNITQVRLEKVMARATTKCTVNEQKKSTLFTMTLLHSYLRIVTLCSFNFAINILSNAFNCPMNKLIYSQVLHLLLKIHYEIRYELGLY